MRDMRENGSLIKISVKEKADKFGQMALCMRAGGWTTKPMAKEGSFTDYVYRWRCVWWAMT